MERELGELSNRNVLAMATIPKKTSLTALQDWLEETGKQDPARHSSPRFSSDTKGTHQTAEHHSLSRPRTLSGEETDTHVPGAFPDDSKRSRSLGRTAAREPRAPVEKSEVPVSERSTNILDEDLSLAALNPIPPPRRPGSDQPHVQLGSQPGDTIARAHHPSKERHASSQAQTTHTGSSFIHEIEEVAAEVYHEAEHMLHDVGETVSAYFSGGKTSTDTASDRGETIRPRMKPSVSAPARSLRTAHIPDVHVTVAEAGSTYDQGITESMRGTKISGTATTLPHTIQHEYFRSNEYDLDGDRLDTGEFLFDDDVSDQDPGMDPIPGEGSKAARRTLGGEDIGVGYGGVEYYLKGHGGTLPGYPTPEGMGKLISERMKDDRFRAAGAENLSTSSPSSGSNPSGDRENVVRGRAQMKGEPSASMAVAGPYSELVSEGSPAEISPENRIVGEKREVPVFVTGEPAAAGKYEAIFEPVADEPEERQPLLKERVQPDTGSETARSAKSGGEPLGPGHLGGPTAKEQEMAELEKARQAPSKN